MDILVSQPQQHQHQSCHLLSKDRYNNITDIKLERSQQKLQNIMYNNNSNNKGGDFPQRSTHNPNSNNISNRDKNTNTNTNSNAMPSIVASGNSSSSAVAYQRNNNQYLMSNNPILVNGSTGPLKASSQLQLQQQRHQQQQQQQQRVLRTTVDDLELIRMKDNIEETIRIQDRLETIQRLQQAEASRTLQRGRFGNNVIGPGTVHSNNANLNNNNRNGRFVVPDIVRNNIITTTNNKNNKNSSTTGSNSLNRGRGQDQGQSVIVPVQQREDERTIPINMKIHDALSTLSETAVALVNARSSSNKNTITPNNSKGSSFIANANNIGNKMNVGNMTISSNNNNSSNKSMNKNNDHNDKVGIGIGGTHLLGALLGRTSSSKKRAASSATTTNATKDDALSREITKIQNKIHACAENNHQRPLYDTTTGSNNGTTTSTPSLSLPSSAPSWLRNTVADATTGRVSSSGGTGNIANTTHSTVFEHLYQQQQKLQQHFQLLRQKNLLPSLSSTAITATNTASNTTGEFPSPRSQKRRRLEQKIQELQRRNSIDSLERSREMNMNTNTNLNMNNKNTFLAAAATGNSFTSPVVVQPQPHRPNTNSSAASTGSIVASNSRATVLSVNAVTSHALQEKLLVESLDRLCKSGGFPMPPIVRNDDVYAYNQTSSINDGPAKITLGANKGVVEVLDGESSTRQRQRRHHGHQWNIGGFPMPPFAVDPATDPASAYSNTNRKTNANNTQASRPPTLNLYKQLWRDIRVVAGDDPKIDERLRKEVFARKIQRGGFFTRSNNKNAHHQQHHHQQQQQQEQQRRRLGGIYNNSNNDNCNNGSQQMKKKTL